MLADRRAILSELDQKVQLLADETGHAGDQNKPLEAKVDEFVSDRRALKRSKSVLKDNSHKNSLLEIEQRRPAKWFAEGRGWLTTLQRTNAQGTLS